MSSEATTPVGEWEPECDGCDGDRCVYVGSLCNPGLVSAPAVVGEAEATGHGSVYDRLLTLLGDRDNAIQGDLPSATELDASVQAILEIVRTTPSPAIPDREEIVAVLRGVIAEADRDTPGFRAARSLLAKLEGES